MEFQLSYFKSWKMMLWKCCTQYASIFGNLSSGHRIGKRSVFILILKKGNAKECSNYCTIAFISHTSKVMLKILQARLQQYMNHELPDAQAAFSKRQRNQRWNCQHPLDHWKIKSARKASTSALLTMPKPLTVWITINWKILKEMGIPDHLTCLLRNLYVYMHTENCMQLELDVEQQNSSQ